MNKKETFLSVLLFFFLTCVLLWQMIIKGMYLFPGDYLVAWFEPYKSENFVDGNILVPHKPVNDDVFRHIYPFQTLAVDMIKHGQMPLWNPYNGAGMPLLATLNSGLIDPSNMLYFFFPDEITWNITLFLQFLLIGFFTYLYTRTLHFGKLASSFAAIAFMLSGFAVARVSFGIYGFAIASLPLLLFIVEKYLADPKTRHIFLLPIIFFFLVTASQPPISFYILLFTVIYFVVKVFSLDNSLSKKLSLFIIPGIFTILSFTLAAIQIIPTMKLLHYANFSSETSEYVEKFLVPIQHLISIGIPNYFGNAATYNFWGQTDYVQTVASIGLLPCFFAYLYIFFSKPDKNRLTKHLFAFTIVVTCLMAVASPISHALLKLPIPFLSTDPPSRIFLITTFAIAILAGGGLDYFIKNHLSFKKRVLQSLPFLIILGIIITITAILVHTNTLCKIKFHEDCYQVAFRNSLLETGIFFIGFFVFLFSPLLIKQLGRFLAAGAIVIIVFGIGFYNAQKFFPFTTKDHFLPVSPFIRELQINTKDGRVFGFGDATIATNLATYFRFYGPQYYHPLYIKRYGELTAYGNYGTLKGTVQRSDAQIRDELELSPTDEARRNRLLSLLNVKYFIFSSKQQQPSQEQHVIWSDSYRYITENEQSLPRAFIVSSIRKETTDQQILKTLFSESFDPTKQIIVEENVPFTLPDQETKGTVEITKPAENSIEMQTKTTDNSMLVLLDNYYPGWKAYIDGEETHIYRADYAFRAIVLPQGEHTVKFIYKPKSTETGLLISTGTGVLLLFLFLFYTKLRGKNN